MLWSFEESYELGEMNCLLTQMNHSLYIVKKHDSATVFTVTH